MLLLVIESLLLVWLALVGIILLRYAGLISRLWLEPVLRRPVLIIESDDWGAGPLAQTVALEKLTALLSKFSDNEGRHPVMTLGMVMAIADTEALKTEGLIRYHRLTLDDHRFSELRQVMIDGINGGVFVPQLHGMEHYWPAALIEAANSNESVRQWLTGDALPETEQLPPALQSRWIDASVLPARAIDQKLIPEAVCEEVATFRHQFKTDGVVVVPPTFVWNREVEQAWSEQGVNAVVTPGCRYEGRDANGEITSAVACFYNGQKNDYGVVYVVRDTYFEPAKGQRAEGVLEAFKCKNAAGRPTMIETHRFNFIGTEQDTAIAFSELERLLSSISSEFPETAFIPTAVLARAYHQQDSAWLSFTFSVRLRVFVNRCRIERGLWRWLRLSGLSLIFNRFAGEHKP